MGDSASADILKERLIDFAVRVIQLACLIFLLLACTWLVPALRAAEKVDVPAGYEAAPIAAGRVKPKPVHAKNAPLQGIGGQAVQAFNELLEKTAWDKPDEKPKEVIDPRVLALERQFHPKFQKLFKAERYRVYLVCGLSPENRRLFARQLDPLLKDVVRIYCLAENRRRRGSLRQKAGLDPQQLIRDRMARLVRDEFGPDAARRYFDANRLSRDRRKRVTVVNMVALLDRQLIFSSEQRQQLTESLTAHWQDAWGQALPLLMMGTQYFPRIPDSLILPLLDGKQKAVWRGLPKKNSRVVLGNLAFGLRFGVVEEEVDSKQ